MGSPGPEARPPGPPPDDPWQQLLDLLAAGMAKEAEDLARQLRGSRGWAEPQWGGTPGAGDLPPDIFMDPDQRRALEFLQRDLPREYQEFIEALTKQPAERGDLIGGLMDRYRHAMELQRENPEAFEREMELRRLEDEAWGIGERIQQTGSEEEKEALGKELRGILDRIFDTRQEQRRKQIERMKEELGDLEGSVKRLDENREKAIQKKFNEMTGRRDELDFM